jgi:hypothetical protein
MRSADLIKLYDVVGSGARVTIVDEPLATVVYGLPNAAQAALTLRSGMTLR